MKGRMRAAQSFILLVVVGVVADRAHAGAWAQPEGHVYAKLSGIRYTTSDIYNEMGRRQAMGTNGDEFVGQQFFAYVEYGLRQRITLVTQARAGVLTDEDNFVRMETSGIGDIEAGLKVQAIDGPVVLAPMLMVKLPTGYNDRYMPPMGTGHVDIDARLIGSQSLYPWPLYVSAELGYRLRGGEFSNQVLWSAEVGATPHERLFAKGFAAGTTTRVPDVEQANVGVVGASTQVSEGNIVNMGINVAVQMGSGLWLDLLWERAVDGENIGAGSSIGVGLSVSR